MHSVSRGLCIGLMLLASGSAGIAQSRGGGIGGAIGGIGGAVGGTVGGVGGTVGGTVGGVGGAIGGTVGGVGGAVGGLGGPFSSIGNSVGGLGSGIGSGTQTIGGRLVNYTNQAFDISREDIELELESNLNQLEYGWWAREVPAATLLDLRKLRLAQLVKDSNGRLEMDGAGNPTVRGRLIAVDPTKASLSAARRAGFTVIARESDPVLGIGLVVLASPRGLKSADAMLLLRRSAPSLIVEFDHVFEPAGGTLAASSVALAASTASVPIGGRPLIGMIDGGVAESPTLAHAAIEQKGFAGPPQATGHGTAIASLIVGSNGKFRGAAPNAALLVGDVYGGNPAAGSALAIAKALSWVASQRPSVINISLVGPHNRVVERAVRAAQARGIKIVAPVGNDGPAAPPLYPASQAGVIAVTGVDATSRALTEAGKPLHLDYSAPGADMAAALPGKGYANVRGTSFAAPFVAARLALTGSTLRLDSEADRKGYGRIGRGIVCKPCRVAPKKVGLR